MATAVSPQLPGRRREAKDRASSDGRCQKPGREKPGEQESREDRAGHVVSSRRGAAAALGVLPSGSAGVRSSLHGDCGANEGGSEARQRWLDTRLEC